MSGEQAIFNLQIKKKIGLSLNPDIHHSKVPSSGHSVSVGLKLVNYTQLGFPANETFREKMLRCSVAFCKNKSDEAKFRENNKYIFAKCENFVNTMSFIVATIIRRKEFSALIAQYLKFSYANFYFAKISGFFGIQIEAKFSRKKRKLLAFFSNEM